MKNTTKFIAIAVAAMAMFFTTQVKAQTSDPNKWRLGIGIEGGIPTGDITSFSNFNLGGTARLQYGVGKDFAITLTSGYYNFFAKSSSATIGGVTYTTKPSDLGMVPIKAGVKYFFVPSIYLGGEAGVGLETNYAKYTKLLLTPGIGWANKSWDVGVRYENYSGQGDSFGTVALRIAYGFSL
jgi:hypothetical protein